MISNRRNLSFIKVIAFLLILQGMNYAQTDNTNYPWPLLPQTSQKDVSGVFAEYRSTSVNGHFHNGTDIPAPAGTGVFAVLPGVVMAAYDDGADGYNSYVRIKANINGISKHITYYHTRPVVNVGDYIEAGQQISRIAIDHVHLTEYELGDALTNHEINSLRPGGGLNPYSDPWKPVIHSVRFLVDNTDIFLPSNALGKKVDIIANIEEFSGVRSSAGRNGTYKAGYKILNASGDSVVFSPPDDGLRFLYYNRPRDEYVNVNYYRPESSTSKFVYILTNGTGASNVAATQVVSNNYWDVEKLPFGNYTVMVYTEDFRGNADTVYIPVTTTDLDLTPPSPPQMRFVKSDSSGRFSLAWFEPGDPDVKGYRLSFSFNGLSYQNKETESVLTAGNSSISYSFKMPDPLYLRLTAVDNAPVTNESVQSDVYGLRMMDDDHRILIVDGFDSYGNNFSWRLPYHDFIVSYGQSFNMSFESCSNDEIISGNFNLNDYEMVIWILGEESTENETFSPKEQSLVKNYLESGGKFFVSGSETAWDLEGSPDASESDKEFLHNYLKVKFLENRTGNHGVYGKENSSFEGLGFGYGVASQGSPYNENNADVIDTCGGSESILTYNHIATAGAAFTGKFGESSKTGQVVYLAFPFETIWLKEARENLMAAITSYFGLTSPAGYIKEYYVSPEKYSLRQNFPNPFNPSTTIRYSIPLENKVVLKVYNVLGKEVATLVNKNQQAGNYSVNFNASGLSSGIYIYKISAGLYTASKKLILLK